MTGSARRGQPLGNLAHDFFVLRTKAQEYIELKLTVLSVHTRLPHQAQRSVTPVFGSIVCLTAKVNRLACARGGSRVAGLRTDSPYLAEVASYILAL